MLPYGRPLFAMKLAPTPLLASRCTSRGSSTDLTIALSWLLEKG